jgi:hypothetical protein
LGFENLLNFIAEAALADSAASQEMGFIIGICSGVLLFLLLLLGIFYMRL